MKVCAIIGFKARNAGSREDKDSASQHALRQELYARLEKLIKEESVTHFICGMAAGPEMLASEVILELREKYPGITLESVIPYENQAARWSEKLRDRYFGIAAGCDKETMLQRHYSPDCLDRQYLYLLERADIVVPVCGGAGEPEGPGQGQKAKAPEAALEPVV